MNLMLTKVQKWGNSLAVRIPKAFATDARLENDSLVEISLVDGQIIVKPLHRASWSLEDLLDGVKPENLHRETDTGAAIGNEAW
jgi:antitoxin MazE